MEISTPTLLFSTLALFLIYSAAPAFSSAVPENTFIKTSCRITRFPVECEQSLTPYAKIIQKSPKQLTESALQVSLTRTRYAQTFMTRLSKSKGLKAHQSAAIRDCLEEVADSLDRVSKSCDEMKNMGRPSGNEFMFHMSNVETWVSAALTDETTCMDGFSGRGMDGKIKESVRAELVGVAHVTSNALAFVNNFAQKHV